MRTYSQCPECGEDVETMLAKKYDGGEAEVFVAHTLGRSEKLCRGSAVEVERPWVDAPTEVTENGRLVIKPR